MLEKEAFQSLVGTLKTFNKLKEVVYRILVSIPCRYAKNVAEVNKKVREEEVSIPCRYAKNSL